MVVLTRRAHEIRDRGVLLFVGATGGIKVVAVYNTNYLLVVVDYIPITSNLRLSTNLGYRA